MTPPTFLLARFADLEYAIDLALKGEDGSANLRRILLADVESKRRIVARHTDCDDTSFGEPCDDLKDLAAPYADHPDCRDEWKP